MAIRGGLNLGTEFRRVLGIVLGGRSPGCYRGFGYGVHTGRVFWLFKLIEDGQIGQNGQS